MKKLSVLFLTLCLCLACVGCGAAPEPETAEDTHAPSIHWRRDVTGKYLRDDAVRQIIAVQAGDGTDAVVTLFEKSEVNGKDVWTETLRCDGYIGLSGLGKTKEGDNKTPTGDFGVTCAFGIKENPGTVLPYVDVDENTYCCGCEGEWYNQIIDISEHPHDCANGEHLIEYSPEYNYGLFLDYNAAGEAGKGSAIFFHCSGANTYTGGCIAVSEENMLTILNAAEPGIRVIIDYLP